MKCERGFHSSIITMRSLCLYIGRHSRLSLLPKPLQTLVASFLPPPNHPLHRWCSYCGGRVYFQGMKKQHWECMLCRNVWKVDSLKWSFDGSVSSWPLKYNIQKMIINRCNIDTRKKIRITLSPCHYTQDRKHHRNDFYDFTVRSPVYQQKINSLTVKVQVSYEEKCIRLLSSRYPGLVLETSGMVFPTGAREPEPRLVFFRRVGKVARYFNEYVY